MLYCNCASDVVWAWPFVIGAGSCCTAVSEQRRVLSYWPVYIKSVWAQVLGGGTLRTAVLALDRSVIA